MRVYLLILVAFLLANCNSSEKKLDSKSISHENKEFDREVKKRLIGEWFLESTNVMYYDDAIDSEPFISDKSKEMNFKFSKDGLVFVDSLKVGKWSLNGKKLKLSSKFSKNVNFDLNFEYLINRLDKTGLELKGYYFNKDGQIKLELEYILSRKPTSSLEVNGSTLEL